MRYSTPKWRGIVGQAAQHPILQRSDSRALQQMEYRSCTATNRAMIVFYNNNVVHTAVKRCMNWIADNVLSDFFQSTRRTHQIDAVAFELLYRPVFTRHEHHGFAPDNQSCDGLHVNGRARQNRAADPRRRAQRATLDVKHGHAPLFISNQQRAAILHQQHGGDLEMCVVYTSTLSSCEH